MVRQKGFEPPTFWFVAKHSIQLSYWRIQDVFVCDVLADCFISYHSMRPKVKRFFIFYFSSSSISPIRLSNRAVASSTGFGLAISTPAPRSSVIGSAEQPPDRKPR